VSFFFLIFFKGGHHHSHAGHAHHADHPDKVQDTFELLHTLLKQKVLVIDGAMGTMVQGYKLSEEEFRGERFKDHPKPLKGNNDLLCLTRPHVIEEM
jgi:5-methyltetrahydrofolate--homocysteine methyltransferase